MAFCSKCGTQIDDGIQFCPACGAVQTPSAPSAGGADVNDISENKVMGILAYFGPLVLIPIFAAPTSKFARYHSNQGLLLLIGEAILMVLNIILGIIFPFGWLVGGAVYTIFNVILTILWIGLGILAILGLVNAAQGKMKELPLIGKFRLLK